MQKKPTAQSTSRPRADKKRNHARLIVAAQKAFADRGASATLEQIARDAGVGIGTLYRHFPTRDTLLVAIYQQEVDALVEAASRLTEDREPVAALREWLLLFVNFLDAKQHMAEALSTLIDGPDALYSGTPNRLATSIEALVNRAAETGPFEVKIEPLDLLRAIAGVANVRPTVNWKRSAVQMVDLLIQGMGGEYEDPLRR